MNSLRKAAEQALEALELRCGTNADERRPDGAITKLRAALAEPDIPEGWQLVPVEPTSAMTGDACLSDMSPYPQWKRMNENYKAMLAAAPKLEDVE